MRWVCDTMNSCIVGALEDTAPSWPPPVIIIITLLRALLMAHLEGTAWNTISYLYVAWGQSPRSGPCLKMSNWPPSLPPHPPRPLPPRLGHYCLTQTSFFSPRPQELRFNKHRSINKCVYQWWDCWQVLHSKHYRKFPHGFSLLSFQICVICFFCPQITLLGKTSFKCALIQLTCPNIGGNLYLENGFSLIVWNRALGSAVSSQQQSGHCPLLGSQKFLVTFNFPHMHSIL